MGSLMLIAYGFKFFIRLVCAGTMTTAKCLRNSSRWFRWDITLSSITLLVESISAAIEQTSPYKLKAAEFGVIIATTSLILCLADLTYKKYIQGGDRRVANEFADIIGLIFSLLTVFSASLHYYYLVSNGREQPIRFSMLPLGFSALVFFSSIFQKPINEPTTFTTGSIREGHMNGGRVNTLNRPSPFVCSVCHANAGYLHPVAV